MKFLISVLTFSFLSVNALADCQKAILSYQNRDIKLCFDKATESYLSPDCKSMKECFFKKDFKLTYNPNQAPGFALCYQLGGDPFFGKIKEVTDKIPFCLKDGHFADQESLLLYYRDYIYSAR